MCVICLEFQKTKDLEDARRMVANARKEPGAIEERHLDELDEKFENLAHENEKDQLSK